MHKAEYLCDWPVEVGGETKESWQIHGIVGGELLRSILRAKRGEPGGPEIDFVNAQNPATGEVLLYEKWREKFSISDATDGAICNLIVNKLLKKQVRGDRCGRYADDFAPSYLQYEDSDR